MLKYFCRDQRGSKVVMSFSKKKTENAVKGDDNNALRVPVVKNDLCDELCATSGSAYTEKEKAEYGSDYAEFAATIDNGEYVEVFDESSSIADKSDYPDRPYKRERSEGAFYSFIKKVWPYLAAPIGIFALFFGVLYAYDVYPFSYTSMSNYDLLAQICPFIEHFYDVMDGKSSLLYSTAIMGGADVFGTLAYCCISPFTFLFLLCGKGNVYYAVSFVLPIKLSCVAISAIYFIKKHFKNIPSYSVLALAVLYSYCGYTFVANTYINWVDFLIYMPFVVSGFIKLVKEKKMMPFAVAYALMIYTCFSIASFALLTVYLIFFIYVIVCVERNERKDVLFKMCCSLVVSVAMALPLMVPAFFAYAKSGRNTGLFENMNNPIDVKHLDAKLTYIISDTCFLFFTVVYFFKHRLKKRQDVFLFIVGILIMMPVLVDEVCNLLNAGSYMSYALRFGFLNVSYALYLCCKVLDEVEEKRVKPVRNVIFTVLFAILAAVAAVVLVTYCRSVIKKDGDTFSGPFAHSLGGIDVLTVIALNVAGILGVALVFYKCRLSTYRALSVVMLAVFATQVAFYNVFLVKGNLFDPVRYVQYNAIADTIKNNYESEEDGYYYRIKDYDDAITNDAAFPTHTNCFSVFSSVIDATNIVPTKFFGYGGNEVNCIKSKGGLFFGDALLGYKYYYVHNDSYKHKDKTWHESMRRSYNTLLEDTEQSYFQGVRNELCFPNAFTVSSGDCIFDGDYYANMTKLYRFLGGEGELFDEYEIKPVDITYNSANDYYYVRVYIADEGQWYMRYDFPEGFDLKYSLSSDYEEAKMTALGDNVINFNYNKKAPSSYYHVYLKADGCDLTAADIAKYCKGACLPLSKIQTISDLAKSRAAAYRIVGGQEFVVSAYAESDGEYLFMNYVAIDGFKATVNGRNAELIDNGLNFMLVKLDKGENNVVIKYSSPYKKYALVGVLLGAAAILAVIALTLFAKKRRELVTTIVCFAAFVLAVGVFGFFYCYPTALFLKKLVVLLF